MFINDCFCGKASINRNSLFDFVAEVLTLSIRILWLMKGFINIACLNHTNNASSTTWLFSSRLHFDCRIQY